MPYKDRATSLRTSPEERARLEELARLMSRPGERVVISQVIHMLVAAELERRRAGREMQGKIAGN